MRSTLNQASASGGETSPVPTPFEQNIELGDIASNRSDLLLQTFVAGESEMPLWILPALGGVPRRVGDVFGARRGMVAGRKKDRICERPRVVRLQG